MAALSLAGVVIIGQELANGGAAVSGPIEQGQHHLMVDAKRGGQRFRLSADELLEGVFAPVGVAAIRGLLLDHLLLLFSAGGGLAGLGLGSLVLHDVRWGLHPDIAHRVETLPPGPSGDLGELAVREQSGGHAVVLAELGEEDRAYGDVDANAERVGTADDLEEALLGQLLDQQTVFRKQARVMDPDAAHDVAAQVLTDGGVEPEVPDGFSHQILLGL